MSAKIPKIIHLVWFGGQKPSKFNFLLEEIKRINDDYEIKEWNENNINFSLLSGNAINLCENLGAKSDILRFEVLYKFGGIYMDYDFLQIKKFDELLNHDFFAGGCEISDHEIWNSIIGTKPENEVCKIFLENLSIDSVIPKWDVNGVMSKTGPYYLTKIINEYDLKKKISYMGGKYFYPFPAVERQKINELTKNQLDYAKSFIDEKTFCIHLHTTSWQ